MNQLFWKPRQGFSFQEASGSLLSPSSRIFLEFSSSRFSRKWVRWKRVGKLNQLSRFTIFAAGIPEENYAENEYSRSDEKIDTFEKWAMKFEQPKAAA